MANTEYSEFSYGYALTDSLMRTILPGSSRAPVFPSLLAEGSAGGGYDVKIPAYPVPLFLQFKIPRVITRRSCLLPPRYSCPYYRFPLRTRTPDQHGLLLDLENKFPLVFYATPLFHTVIDLDAHYVRKAVHGHSMFIRPSAIGMLDDKTHHIAYSAREPICWCFSEPKVVEAGLKGEEFLAYVGRLAGEQRKQTAIAVLETLWRKIIEVVKLDKHVHAGATELGKYPGNDVQELLRRITYLAQVRLGLTLALLGSE